MFTQVSNAPVTAANIGSAQTGYATRFATGPGFADYTRTFPDSNAVSFRSETSAPDESLPVFRGTTREAAHNIHENGCSLELKEGGSPLSSDGRVGPACIYVEI